MDLTESIQPRSDQINADDLIAGPATYTVERVGKGGAEQPVDIHLVESPGRAYRPSKSMRRMLVAAWGKNGDVYAGRRITVYRDPEVTFGRDKVGGVKISHLSHIDKPVTLALTVTRGKRAPFTVQPLAADAPANPLPPTAADVAACSSLADLRAMYRASGPELQELITARVAEIQAAAANPTLAEES